MAFTAGEQVVVVRGLLSGVEARVLRPTRLGRYLIELDTSAPRWAAIRRTRAAEWALAPAGEAPPPELARRRRVAFVDLVAAIVALPWLFFAWNRVPALAVVLAVGMVAGLAALHSFDRVDRRRSG